MEMVQYGSLRFIVQYATNEKNINLTNVYKNNYKDGVRFCFLRLGLTFMLSSEIFMLQEVTKYI